MPCLPCHDAAVATGGIAMKFRTLVVGAFAYTLSLTSTQAVPLVTNGDFETPLVPAGSFTDFAAASPLLTGWTVLGADVAVVSGSYPNTPAQSGNQWLDLMGLDVAGGGSITQTIATTTGQQYNVSFWVGNITSLPGTTSTVDFKVNGNLVLSATNSTPNIVLGWQQFTTSFIATGSSTLIGFFNGDTYPPDVNNGLDNIVIEAANTPLPAALPLFASGLGALGWLGWRRKRKPATVAA